MLRPFATALTLLLLGFAVAPVRAEQGESPVEVPIDPARIDERCTWESFPGSWKSLRTGNVWTFAADGSLSCDGECGFTKVTGAPLGWAYEPGADLFARPISHVRLEFENAVFEGVFGAFRCRIQNDGMTLLLEPEEDQPMVFYRYRAP